MRVFISYPHAIAATAERLAMRLQAEGYKVFWDRTSLPSAESFDDRIRDAIDRSDLFVCLLTREALEDGRYARTELKFARDKWPNPSGHVIPIALDADVLETLPPYLNAVTVTRPEGDVAAEVADVVRRVARRPMRRLLISARVAAGLTVAAVGGWLAYRGLPRDPIQLTLGMSGQFYKDSVEKRIQALRPATSFVELFDHGLRGEQVDGEKLLALVEQDEQVPERNMSPLPVIHFRIANNSGATIIVDRLRLSVRDSRLDARPLLWTSSTMRGTNRVLNASILVGNDGWGRADRLRFSFDIVPEKRLEEPRRSSSRRFGKDLTAVESGGTGVAVFWDELATFGADISYLRDGPHPFGDLGSQKRFDRDVSTLKSAVGANTDERIFAVGELSYTSADGARRELSLQQELRLVYPGPIVAPAMFAAAAYDIELQPEGKNYVVEKEIAHSIAAGSAEAIDLRVWVDKSSIHDMTASIRVGGEWVSARDALRLEYYRPVHSDWAKPPRSQHAPEVH